MALFELLIFSRMRRRVPGRSERGYEAGKGEQHKRALSFVMLASILTPVIAYVILNLIAPEIGAIEIF